MSLRVLLILLAGVATGVALAATGKADPPPVRINVNTTLPAEATDASGADVSYTVTSDLPATCTPAGGPGTNFTASAHFRIGSSTIECSDGTTTASESVTVQDTTPPTVSVPGPITQTTGDPSGTTVSWPAGSVSATDIVDGPVTPVTCSPASGSTFAVGPTTVTCSATDNHGNTGSSSFTVTITFNDTEPPVLTVPSNITASTSGTGTVVTYSVTATDNSGNPPTVNCIPPSGSTFPVGSTTVNCTASDGTNTANASFTVTVTFVDNAAPIFSNVPSNRVVEANGPAGSVVTYASPTATDAAEGPKPVNCSPASGSTFPLGGTTVTCTASDSVGNTGNASFTVNVVDTTKPNLIVPSDRAIYADTPTGIDPSSHYAALFLSEASATDLVDPHPVVSNDAGDFFTVGVHVVSFSARDFSGNSVSKTAVLDVRPMPPAGTPPLPTPAPRSAPAAVLNLKADAGDGRVRLSWQIPSGVDHVVVSRALTAGGDSQVVYTGSAESFTDRGVVNDLEYRYVVVSVNGNGDTSAGVATVALPKRTLLKTPRDGARLRKAPRLVWVSNSEANYYNVQLFRGDRKILSTWPVKTSFQLKKNWKYEGHAFKLSPGVYRWYVWPGFGARKAVDYGELLGFSTFQIVR